MVNIKVCQRTELFEVKKKNWMPYFSDILYEDKNGQGLYSGASRKTAFQLLFFACAGNEARLSKITSQQETLGA